MANRVTTIFDAVDRGMSAAVDRVKKGITEAEGATGKLKAGWSGLMTEFKNSRQAQAAVAGAATAVAVKAISDFSDLQESVNAVEVQYGLAADSVLELGEDSAEAFGMSQRAFNEFATGFSAFANQIARENGDNVATVVGDMATRIADFASVHNLSLEEAEQVAKSTLAGETESFRRFGGDVSAATTKAYAYQQGIADVGAELTEGQKVLARYGLFMDQTATTAGDFANTSDGLANQQRILNAKVEDLSATLGKELYPAAQDAAEAIMILADSVIYLNDKAKQAQDIMPGWTKSITNFTKEVANPYDRIKRLRDGLTGLGRMFGVVGEEAEDAADKVRDYADEDKALSTATNNVAAAQAAAAEATRLAAEQTEIAGDYAEYAAGMTDLLAEANDYGATAAERIERATENAAAAHDLKTRAMESELRASEDLYNQTLLNIGGETAVRRAKIDTEESIVKLTETMADEESTMRDVELAQLDVKDSALAQAEAAVRLAEDQAKANGKTLDAKDKAEIYREELQNVADQLTGPMRDAILGFIADLDSIPANKTVKIGLEGGGAVVIDPNGRKRGARGATGAIVTQPTNALIGEAGPEAVIPLNQMPGARPLSGPVGSAGGVGGVNIYIDKAVVGEDEMRRAVGQAIKMARLS